MTAFNLFTFFCANLIQSDINWKLSSMSDQIMSAQKNCEVIKGSHTFGPLTPKFLKMLIVTLF